MVKRVLRIALWTGLAILLILGVAEGILWVTAPVPKSVGYTVELDNEIPGVKPKVAFEIDERFLRKWGSSNKGERTIRIVCLGGSATAGMLQNDKETWWGQLGTLAREALSRHSVRGLCVGAREYWHPCTERSGRGSILRRLDATS